jgi:outer membrane protein assembly factor BamD
MVKVNSIVEELLRKLERKSFENAKQFYTIRDYKAAIKAIDNFIGDFPGTPFREEAMFFQFRAASILAINSVFSKKEERLDTAASYFDDFVRAYPESEFLGESISIMNDIEKEITTFAAN